MRVHVDDNLCVGHGRCYALAPDVFDADDFGHCEVKSTSVEGPMLEAARVAVANCPEQAISLRDE